MTRPPVGLHLLLLGLVGLFGCAQTVQLDIKRPARMDIRGIETIGIRPFDEVMSSGLNPTERVRGRVVSGLKEGEFYKLGKGGDAIVRGKVWWIWDETTGSEPVMRTKEEYGTVNGIPMLVRTEDYVENVPFTVYRGYLKVELSLIRLSGKKEQTVTTVTNSEYLVRKVGGANAGSASPPDPSQTLDAFAEKTTREFVRRISPYRDTLQVPVAGSPASNLIEQGNYTEALEILKKRVDAAEGEEKAAILYDIGLCYEASGELVDLDEAIRHYRMAIELDPAEEYCQGLGRATLLKREILRLKRQELEKSEES